MYSPDVKQYSAAWLETATPEEIVKAREAGQLDQLLGKDVPPERRVPSVADPSRGTAA